MSQETSIEKQLNSIIDYLHYQGPIFLKLASDRDIDEIIQGNSLQTSETMWSRFSFIDITTVLLLLKNLELCFFSREEIDVSSTDYTWRTCTNNRVLALQWSNYFRFTSRIRYRKKTGINFSSRIFRLLDHHSDFLASSLFLFFLNQSPRGFVNWMVYCLIFLQKLGELGEKN